MSRPCVTGASAGRDAATRSFRYVRRDTGTHAPPRALATAIVGRALDDLRMPDHAQGAARFLVLDLWESDNLWGALVGTVFARRWLLREVVARMRRTRDRMPARAARRLRQAGLLSA